MSLLVVGTLAFDSVETPYGKRQETLGGSANFLALAASYFAPVRMVGVIGQDYPDDILDLCRSRGIDTQGVVRAAGKTFRWHGRYSNDLNVAHTLNTELNVLATFNPEIPKEYLDSKMVFLGNIDPGLQGRVLDQMRSPKLVALDTMNYWIEGANEELRRVLKRIALLSVNDAEARQLSGEHNLVKAARAIQSMGPSTVVIKRGEHGALVFLEDAVFTAPAYPLETVRDPTGAGDSFAGGLMGYLTRLERFDAATLRQAVIVGSVLASFVVEDFSVDRLRDLTLADIRRRFENFKALTHFDVDGTGTWS